MERMWQRFFSPISALPVESFVQRIRACTIIVFFEVSRLDMKKSPHSIECSDFMNPTLFGENETSGQLTILWIMPPYRVAECARSMGSQLSRAFLRACAVK